MSGLPSAERGTELRNSEMRTLVRETKIFLQKTGFDLVLVALAKEPLQSNGKNRNHVVTIAEMPGIWLASLEFLDLAIDCIAIDDTALRVFLQYLDDSLACIWNKRPGLASDDPFER